MQKMTRDQIPLTTYTVTLDHCDAFAAMLFLREFGRLLVSHRLDLCAEPKATLTLVAMPLDAPSQTALENWLEELRLLEAPVLVQVAPEAA